MSRGDINWRLLAVVVLGIAALGFALAAIAQEGSEPKEGGGEMKMEPGSAMKGEMEPGSEMKMPMMQQMHEAGEALINTGAMAALVRAKVPMVVLDARTGEYDDGRRIPGAKSLSPEASEEEITKAVRGKKQLIVTYCQNPQCPVSVALYKRLKKLGYENVIEYPFGIDGWEKAGHKVEKAEGIEKKMEGSAPKQEAPAKKDEGSGTK